MEKWSNRPVVFDSVGKSVLSPGQRRLVPLLEEFSTTHFLWGGTAIALYLGHRKSIDFDFFSLAPQGTPRDLLQRLEKFGDIIDNDAYFQEIVAMDMSGYTEEQDEYMIQALGTKCHFININRTLYKDQTISFHPQEYLQWGIRTIPLEELAGMKCFAMMYRNKWKDAVDVFFIMKQAGMSFKDMIAKAQEIYGNLYREECTYETIIKREWDKTETVDYLIDTPPSDVEIEDFLVLEVNTILREKIES